MSDVPHRLLYLNTWFSVDGAVCGSFGRGSLAGGSRSLETGFETYSLTRFRFTLSCFGVSSSECDLPQFPDPAAIPPHYGLLEVWFIKLE